MIRADSKFNGFVRAGSSLYETATGTMGYQVMLECEDGDTSYIVWLTDKNRDRAAKTFETLGVDSEKLKNPLYFEAQLGIDITGREVSFGTKEEEYKGTRTVKVAWIGKKSESLGGGLSNAAARYFGGDVPEITDADISF